MEKRFNLHKLVATLQVQFNNARQSENEILSMCFSITLVVVSSGLVTFTETSVLSVSIDGSLVRTVPPKIGWRKELNSALDKVKLKTAIEPNRNFRQPETWQDRVTFTETSVLSVSIDGSLVRTVPPKIAWLLCCNHFILSNASSTVFG
jgi:hypothetical protein